MKCSVVTANQTAETRRVYWPPLYSVQYHRSMELGRASTPVTSTDASLAAIQPRQLQSLSRSPVNRALSFSTSMQLCTTQAVLIYRAPWHDSTTQLEKKLHRETK